MSTLLLRDICPIMKDMRERSEKLFSINLNLNRMVSACGMGRREGNWPAKKSQPVSLAGRTIKHC
jgi:hypothetical protein